MSLTNKSEAGTGMHYFAKVQLLRQMIEHSDEKVIIMDPKNECRLFAKQINCEPANDPEKIINPLSIGTSGNGKKIKAFKECKFRNELVPKNSSIIHESIDGENIVIMIYR